MLHHIICNIFSQNGQNTFEHCIIAHIINYIIHTIVKTLNIMNFETKYLLFTLREKYNISFNA